MGKTSDGPRLADVRQMACFSARCLTAMRAWLRSEGASSVRRVVSDAAQSLPASARHADPRKNALSTPGTPTSGTIGGEGHECEARDGMLATLTDDELIWEIELAVEQANADVYDVAAIMELVALTDEADRRGLALAPELREQLREASSHE